MCFVVSHATKATRSRVQLHLAARSASLQVFSFQYALIGLVLLSSSLQLLIATISTTRRQDGCRLARIPPRSDTLQQVCSYDRYVT